MTNVPTVELKVSIPLETYKRVLEITALQNATLPNNVSRLLDVGVDATYERSPHLVARREAHR